MAVREERKVLAEEFNENAYSKIRRLQKADYNTEDEQKGIFWCIGMIDTITLIRKRG